MPAQLRSAMAPRRRARGGVGTLRRALAAAAIAGGRAGVYVQVDSRSPARTPRAKRNESWWWASASLTAARATRAGDVYAHYVIPPTGCVAFDGLSEIAAPWCKVKGMLQAMEDFPSEDEFLFLDSDAAVNENFDGSRLADVVSFVADRAPFFANFSKPVGVGRDGPGPWVRELYRRRKERPFAAFCSPRGYVSDESRRRRGQGRG